MFQENKRLFRRSAVGRAEPKSNLLSLQPYDSTGGSEPSNPVSNTPLPKIKLPSKVRQGLLMLQESAKRVAVHLANS